MNILELILIIEMNNQEDSNIGFFEGENQDLTSGGDGLALKKTRIF